jgi:hypothetical protein
VVVSGATPALGVSVPFTATATLTSGEGVDVTSRSAWSSTAPMVATVASGVVTAHTVGAVDIAAVYGGVTGRLRLNIVKAPSPGLTPFTRDYIESIMLGGGALKPVVGTAGCPWSGRWSAYPVGTTVDLLISQTVPEAAVLALNRAVAAVNEVSAGSIAVRISSTVDPNPMPATNQVTVTMHPAPLELGCSFEQGCTQMSFLPNAPELRAARAILRTGQTPAAYVHDAIGHGTLGLCHVDGNLIGSPFASLMSFGVNILSNQIAEELTGFDRAATLPVYESGLARGSMRADFLAAGLVNPSSAGSLKPASMPQGFAEIPSLRIR